ncbi:MAG TPA: class II aldolase/adducin family protein [Burkholderiales bacterium]|jgi:ribulose-5-phosphate 4-epimerase/fuculose-1-phosphate aldolase|nr:class II aldolase/adducin family protein [Burkholderiales bacterium]
MQTERDVRVQLAACYRLVHHFGWTDLVYTHISARVPGPEEHFLLNPLGYLFNEVTASNLVRIDLEGNNVGASPHSINKAGFVIHSAVHAARPDVQCVIHLHTPAGMAVSMMKCGLLPLSQHAQLFHGRVGYHDYEGIALDLDERRRLVRDLGDKPVMILRNHGTLVAAGTIPLAFSLMFHLEKACQAQLAAMATGQELVLPAREASERTAALAFRDDSPIGRAEWPALERLLEGLDPSYRQ